MIDLAADRLIRDHTQKVVAEISRRWPEEYMKSVQADMEYGQYGGAILNLLAIRHKQNLELKEMERRQIVKLIRKMHLELEVKDLVEHLRGPSVVHDTNVDENMMAFIR